MDIHSDPDLLIDELRTRFAIAPMLDLEIDVAGYGLVGLSPDADHDLRLDVTAAVISRTLGVTVTTARKYLKDVSEHIHQDRALRQLCREHLAAYDNFYCNITPRSDSPIGVFAFDMAMVRARGSIELMLITARQGFLIEPCLIARSIMEQFAYALHVWNSDREDVVFRAKPQALIKHLSSVHSHAGRAYGILSKLAHYDPTMHYAFIGGADNNARGDESSTVVQRSWLFKITSLAWVFFVLDLKFQVFAKCYKEHPSFQALEYLDGSLVEAFDTFFADVQTPAVRQVRALLC